MQKEIFITFNVTKQGVLIFKNVTWHRGKKEIEAILW